MNALKKVCNDRIDNFVLACLVHAKKDDLQPLYDYLSHDDKLSIKLDVLLSIKKHEPKRIIESPNIGNTAFRGAYFRPPETKSQDRVYI